MFSLLGQIVSRDLASAVRTWARAPAFALGTIAITSAGIAALASVFMLVNGVLLQPLPYPEAERLVVLRNAWRGQPSRADYVSLPRARIWREFARSVEDIALYSLGPAVNVEMGGEGSVAAAGHVSAAFFSLFGARPARGRLFTAGEDGPGAQRLVVLSHGFWERQFGADPAVIGRTLSVNGEAAAIIGVLDAGFDGRSLAPGLPTSPELWVPIRLDPATNDDANTLLAVGRLRQGATIAVARGEAEAAAEAFRKAYPGELPAEGTFDVTSLAEVIAGDVRPSLLMLFVATGLLALLITANVTNLFLARASARRREFAIRMALGASRLRLAAHALSETLTLAAVSGVLGSLTGVAVIRTLVQSQGIRIPRLASIGVADLFDGRVLMLVAITVTTMGVILALAPAMVVACRPEAVEHELRSGSRTTSGHQRASSLLLGMEVALACVLVIGAALLFRSLTALQRVEPGFDRQNVLTMQTQSGDRRLASAQAAIRIFEDGLRVVSGAPGIQAAAITLTGVPLAQNGALRVDVVGRPTDRQYMAAWDLVSPRYFDVFGIRLIEGRGFDERDRTGTPLVAIVNETMAGQLWPNGSAIGQRVLIGQGGGPAFDEQATREVIGVVSNVRQFGLAIPPRPGVYVPLAQTPEAQMSFLNRLSVPATWVVRTAPRLTADRGIERALQSATALPVAQVRSMDDVFTNATASAAQNTWLMSGVGLLSMLVAVVGVFALAMYSGEQRTRELAVRMALGAGVGQVRGLVVWQSLRVALYGIAGGMLAAAGLATLMAKLLYRVQPHDPFAFTIIPVVLAGASVAAAYLPARRASKVDPVVILRE